MNLWQFVVRVCTYLRQRGYTVDRQLLGAWAAARWPEIEESADDLPSWAGEFLSSQTCPACRIEFIEQPDHRRGPVAPKRCKACGRPADVVMLLPVVQPAATTNLQNRNGSS